MRRGAAQGLVLLFLATMATPARATEPDGRAALRYEWLRPAPAEHGRRPLRLAVTALVPLDDVVLEASSPSGAAAFVRHVRLASGAEDDRWPDEGIVIGRLPVGISTVLDIDIVEPLQGGEILTISLRAVDRGVPIREALGVPIGLPGTPPVERNGAAEFPAVRDGTQP